MIDGFLKFLTFSDFFSLYNSCEAFKGTTSCVLSIILLILSELSHIIV